jgi:hypothetical protein
MDDRYCIRTSCHAARKASGGGGGRFAHKSHRCRQLQRQPADGSHDARAYTAERANEHQVRCSKGGIADPQQDCSNNQVREKAQKREVDSFQVESCHVTPWLRPERVAWARTTSCRVHPRRNLRILVTLNTAPQYTIPYVDVRVAEWGSHVVYCKQSTKKPASLVQAEHRFLRPTACQPACRTK